MKLIMIFFVFVFVLATRFDYYFFPSMLIVFLPKKSPLEYYFGGVIFVYKMFWSLFEDSVHCSDNEM